MGGVDEQTRAEVAALEAHRAAVLEAIKTMYNDNSAYGHLSQLIHALQSARQAEMSGAPEAIVVGALLHDIGWKLCALDAERTEPNGGAGLVTSVDAPPPRDSIAAKMGILRFCGSDTGNNANSDMPPEQLRAMHDVVGSVWARMNGFDASVSNVIEGHVLAKRYLCFKEPDYYAKLSKGSQRTLAFQGGPMTETEASIFEKIGSQQTLIESRRWDEGAKEPHWEVPTLDYYLPMVARAIVRLPTSDVDAIMKRSTIVRSGNTIVDINENPPDDADDPVSAAWVCPLPPCDALRSPRQTELLAQWNERGYVVLRRHEWLGPSQGAFAENLGKMCDRVEALSPAAPGVVTGPFFSYEETDEGVKPSRTEAFVDHVPEMSEFLQGTTSPVLAIVSHIAGERAKLLKEKINYKYPNGGGYIAHQDGYHDFDFIPKYKSPEDRGLITYVCMIAVDDSKIGNGCAFVAPDTWRRKEGWLEKVVTDKDGGVANDDYEGNMGPFVPIELERGDMLIYDNYMPHFSCRNQGSRRRALFGIYHTFPKDLRLEYYKKESATRRNLKAETNPTGKANQFFAGKPVVPARPILA